MAEAQTDWRIFTGEGAPNGGRLSRLPDPPSWRRSSSAGKLTKPANRRAEWFLREKKRGETFIPTPGAVAAVNAALYLRRPLLLTGSPGVGKSSLISAVAYELELGPVLRWNISSRSTVKSGEYEYDALGRLYSHQQGEDRPLGDFLTLQPLGTALVPTPWPRALLIDEIDKCDLDLANDLLNILEEGIFEIPELSRIAEKQANIPVQTCEGDPYSVPRGVIRAQQFPFVVLTSNGEREFPGPFLRRCIRHTIERPKYKDLIKIVNKHLPNLDATGTAEMETLVKNFLARQEEKQEVATDQLLNAVFLIAQEIKANDAAYADPENKGMIINLVLKQLTTSQAL
jgi:MoxR-like ATPase